MMTVERVKQAAAEAIKSNPDGLLYQLTIDAFYLTYHETYDPRATGALRFQRARPASRVWQGRQQLNPTISHPLRNPDRNSNKEHDMLYKVEWHPWFTNPLDMLGSQNLRTPDGKKVTIEKHTDFRVRFDGQLVYSGSNDNAACCAFLRDNEVGLEFAPHHHS